MREKINEWTKTTDLLKQSGLGNRVRVEVIRTYIVIINMACEL